MTNPLLAQKSKFEQNFVENPIKVGFHIILIIGISFFFLDYVISYYKEFKTIYFPLGQIVFLLLTLWPIWKHKQELFHAGIRTLTGMRTLFFGSWIIKKSKDALFLFFSLFKNNFSDIINKIFLLIISMTFRQKNLHFEKKQNIWFRIFKLMIWLTIIISIVFYYQYSQFKTEVINKEEQIIKITEDDNFYNLWEKFWINNFYYKIYLKNNTPDFELQQARYLIPKDANIEQIIKSLKTPITPEEINITVLEGWNIFDTDEMLTKKGLIGKWEYIKYTENIEKIVALTKFFPFIEWLTSLEGFLYPDTYTIDTSNFKINNFVILQLETFENKVYNKLFKNTQISTSDQQDVINLAAIVEKEERNPNEKSTVAGILKKRLNAGWMIGADITVCYPHRLTSQECKLVITKYIAEKSDYNTRTKRGLPKTAIGNPSFETINATLNDKDTPYWFYLHNIKSWKVYYWKTNAEHTANKKFMH